MCGIAGFVTTSINREEAQHILSNMTDTLIHRGPDDSGTVIVPNNCRTGLFGLGHRRLTIIDLTAMGRQPMASPDGAIQIVFNGEIYNYIELKDELKAKGYTFKSTSDTEVVIASYLEWGETCFAHFNGMWAMAISDTRNDKLILSRDRFGKKPLYYYMTDSELVFASEIKAFYKHPNFKAEPDYDKIFKYISTNYRYVDVDNHTFFEGVYQVPKSSYMIIDCTLKPRTNKYWSLDPFIDPVDISEEQAIEKFRELLIDSVKIRLRSDVPVGCMLSGGMDSTSVTCIAYEVLKQPVITFSGITGDVKGVYDESEYIDSVVKKTNAIHHYLRPDPANMFVAVEEMLDYHDEPVCTVTWHSLYLIAKKVRLENVPVLLNGHGGDEILGGYWDHYHYNFYDIEQSGNRTVLEHEKQYWLDNHGRDPQEISRTREYINKLMQGQTTEMNRFVDYSNCFLPDVVAKYRRAAKLSVPCCKSLLSKRLYSELMFETVPASLRAEDRNTMANSIESRSPMLDYRLAEFCLSLPNRFKIRDGIGKWLLRESMRNILPEDVRTRKDKAGFISPADEWFRTTNREQVRELINSQSLKNRGLFDIAELNRIFDEHIAGTKNHQMFLWQLINLELWFRKFFD
ncbi:MAG: asparagine synthase (glutamine-hydrolyzing) [Acidobacteriota bacterium]